MVLGRKQGKSLSPAGRESLIRQQWKLGSKERGDDLALKAGHQTPLPWGPGGESTQAPARWASSGEGSLVSPQSLSPARSKAEAGQA